MLSSSPRDNWERLVVAVLKKDQIWQLCHQDSITTVSSNSQRPSVSSGEILSISSSGSRRISLSSPRQTLLTGAEATKNTFGIQKIFSALLGRKKPKGYDLGQDLAGIPEENFGSVASCLRDGHFGFASFSLSELRDATDGFSKRNVIGQGGHSTVYKGRLRDGSLVAIKRLRQQVIEIELEMAYYLLHRNVVPLYGFCMTEKEQLLVYPYMANGSVASCLIERHKMQPPLNLAVIKKIALGVAKGLAYLHHECSRVIIHRDIKAANILLDEDFEAVVADFTLAKFTDCYDDDIVTTVRGTIGHIAPEYLSTGNLSVKTDVFSYGVFLLELITGNRALDLAQLANQDGMQVKKHLIEKTVEVMVDQDLRGILVEEVVEKLLQVALTCRQSDPKERPSMLEVVRMLEYDDEDMFNVASMWERLLNNESEPLSNLSTEWIIRNSLSFTAAEELSGPR